MTLDEFRRSLGDAAPPERASGALEAIWWAGKGEWDRAHQGAQAGEGDPACDLVHAHLHRREGDLGNAGYWYRRAAVPVSTAPLDAEWGTIAQHLLDLRARASGDRN